MFKVQNSGLKKITLSGSPMANGQKIGSALKGDIHKLLRRDRRLLDTTKKSSNSLVAFLRRKISNLFPDSIAELEGMAEGAKVDFLDLFLENCPELLRKEGGCTSAVIKNQKDFFMIHNEDESRARPQSSVALARYSGRSGDYTGFIYAGELAGNAFGWSEKGWFYSVNYLPVKKTNLRSASRYFVAHHVLRQKSIADAVKFLKSVDDASGFHYLMGDIKGKTASVEKRLGGLSVQSPAVNYCHSNHYIHPKFKSLETVRTKSSVLRLSVAQNSLKQDLDQRSALNIWRKELSRPFDKYDHDAKTFATVLADLKKKTISIY